MSDKQSFTIEDVEVFSEITLYGIYGIPRMFVGRAGHDFYVAVNTTSDPDTFLVIRTTMHAVVKLMHQYCSIKDVINGAVEYWCLTFIHFPNSYSSTKLVKQDVDVSPYSNSHIICNSTFEEVMEYRDVLMQEYRETLKGSNYKGVTK